METKGVESLSGPTRCCEVADSEAAGPCAPTEKHASHTLKGQTVCYVNHTSTEQLQVLGKGSSVPHDVLTIHNKCREPLSLRPLILRCSPTLTVCFAALCLGALLMLSPKLLLLSTYSQDFPITYVPSFALLFLFQLCRLTLPFHSSINLSLIHFLPVTFPRAHPTRHSLQGSKD